MTVPRLTRRLLVADLLVALLVAGLAYVLAFRLLGWPPVGCAAAAMGCLALVGGVAWVAESRAAGVVDEPRFLAEVFAGEVAGPVQVVIGAVPWEPAAYQPREDLLARLEQAVALGRAAVMCNLAGTTGVGKTQLAGAYARSRVEGGCPLVVWVSGETSAQLLAGLAAAADRLGVAAPDGDSETSALALRKWLEERAEPALVVFDNAVDADLITAYAPESAAVEVVLTTTQRTFDALGRLVEVGEYEPAESVAYLCAATGLPPEGAAAVGGLLAHHPLALAQAAAVISARRLSFAAYADQLAAVPPAVMRSGKPYPKGTAEAISLAVLTVEEADPTGPSGLVLGLLAVLSTDGVPRALLEPLPLRPAELTAALGRVTDANLAGWAGVPWDAVSETLVMHRLVARVIRERANQAGELTIVLRAAAQLIAGLAADPDVVPDVARQLPEQAAAMWDAGRRVWPTLKRGDPTLVEVFAGRRAAVRYLVNSGDHSGAARYGADTLADAVRFLGPASPDTRGLRSILAATEH